MKVGFDPRALEDLRSAADFYESRAAGLGSSFATEAETTRDLIARFPEIGPTLDGNIRRLSLHRFPYSFLYRIVSEQVQVIAVMHHRRHPESWKSRK